MNNTAVEHLPHRYPLRLPDRVVQRTPEASVTTEKRLTAADFWFQAAPATATGFPEMLLLELCAQTAGLLLPDQHAGEPAGMLCAIPEFTFSLRPAPGDTLAITARLEGRFGTMLSAECRVTCDGRECAAGRLTLKRAAPVSA